MNNQRNGRRSNLCFRWLLSALVLLGVVGFVSTLAWTQVTSGSLTGLVTDPSGAVVPGAKVVLTDTNKGYDYPATADSVGRYVITNLPPSAYSISAEAPGFKTYRRGGIVLNVGTSSSVDVRLEVGATAQAVDVTAAAPLLSTQDAVTGQEVDRTLINDLPLVGRAIFDLALPFFYGRKVFVGIEGQLSPTGVAGPYWAY